MALVASMQTRKRGCTRSEIEEATGIDRQNVIRQIDRLISKGLVFQAQNGVAYRPTERAMVLNEATMWKAVA